MWTILLALLLWQAVPIGSSGSAGFGISANFNGRSGGAVIPANFTATNISSLSASTPLSIYPTAGLNYTRLFVSVNQHCNTGTCNWAISAHGQLTLLKNAGLKVMVVWYQTPTNLGTGTTTCSVLSGSDLTTMAGYIANGVHDFDTNYAGTVTAYEIWNEPDLPANLCPGAGTALAGWQTYFQSFYSAIKTQLTTDGAAALVGGPALAAPATNAATWFANTAGGILASGLTNYPDFVSYHMYPAQPSSWADALSKLQSVSAGVGFYYNAVDALVRAGHQPNASTTPIWITEFNTDAGFTTNTVRNDSTNSPMWNSLNGIDYLNAIAGGATTIPQEIFYYSSETNAAYFCMDGTIDGGMDCSLSGTRVAYPQWYAYQLFNNSSFLNMTAGGNLAQSVSPASTVSGISCAAFYTAAGDSIACVNPTNTSYGGVTIVFANPGSVSGTCTAYLLNAANSSITSSSPTCTAISGGYETAIPIPALSVVAIKII